jgi:hypothetical protein
MKFTYCGTGAATWAKTGDTINSRCDVIGAGTQNAGLVAGGFPTCIATEEYNGSTWATGGNMTCTRDMFAGGSGTQNAALAIGGRCAGATSEEYNGSTWSSIAPGIGSQYGRTQGTGTQNATVAFTAPLNVPGQSKEYNGSTWSAATATPTLVGNRSTGITGTQNAAIGAGGGPQGSLCTATYNGTTWSLSPAALNKRRCDGSMGGSQNSAVITGGVGFAQNNGWTEKWNGVTWSTETFLPLTIANPTNIHEGQASNDSSSQSMFINDQRCTYELTKALGVQICEIL